MGAANLGTFRRPSFDLLPTSTSVGSSKGSHTIRCISDLVRFNAIHNPHHVFCLQSWQPSDETASKFQFSRITYSQLASAVEQCCDWILCNIPGTFEARLKPDGTLYKSAPVALFMESDVGLFVYMLSLLTLNIPCLLLSIRLSPNAVKHLLKETRASSILATTRMSSNVNGLQSEKDIEHESLEPVVTAAPIQDFMRLGPSNKQALERLTRSQQLVRESDCNVFILHSSGTTGLPKAIHLAHRYLLGYAACHSFPAREDEYSRGINLSTLPLYHGFGALAPCLALSIGKTVCFPPSSTIPNASLVISLLKEQEIKSLMSVPNIMEEMTRLEDFSAVIELVASLDFVAVGGGGMKAAIARSLHENGVKLLNHFGATELGALAPIFRPQADYDYRYLRLRTDLGLTLKFTEDGSRLGSEEPRLCKLVGRPFAWDSDFELQDALENNPSKPDSEVRILGRNDDIIVLATGEKVMPNILEQAVEAHSDVKAAVVLGQGQFEIGLLIEPATKLDDIPSFVENIWPHVESANGRMDRHARISTKDAILVKPAAKDIPRTDKGSIRRREVYDLFEEEIRRMYDQLEAPTELTGAATLDLSNLRSGVRAIVQTCLPEHVQEVDFEDDDDLINLGLDSLQVTRLRRQLNSSLRSLRQNGHGSVDLPLDFVYSNPSITRLSAALKAAPAQEEELRSRKETMMTVLLEKYLLVAPPDAESKDICVLLTGGTGSLGAHLLQELSETPAIKRIICLSRPSSSSPKSTSREAMHSRQIQSSARMGIMMSKAAWLKVNCFCWEPSGGSLGVSEVDYQEIIDNVTHIFHGAWPMDFQRNLSSFETQIKTARDILQLGRDIHKARPLCRPRVALASSIATVGRCETTVVPEQVPESPDVPLPMGYAEAKLICEKIFENAFTCLRGEMDPVIVRVGQVSGSQGTGFWSTQEHMAAIVKASQAISAMPDLVGTLSWLPVNRAAKVASEILIRPESLHPQLVFHLENPIRQPWPDMLTFIERKLGISSSDRLPFSAWMGKGRNNKVLNPSLCGFLESYFKHMSGGEVVLDTQHGRKISPTLRSTGAVDNLTVDLYIDYWRSLNYLT